MKMRYILCLTLIIILFLSFGCTKQTQNNENITNLENSNETNVDKVEIYHFHGNVQCYSCIKVGDLAEETINTYFKKELAEGKVVFAHINSQLKENEEFVKIYGATGSSLMIGTYKNGQLTDIENNILVWYKIEKKQEFMDYLKEVIETKLAGN